MRKEIQFRVKQDLNECTPAPADTLVIKDVIVDESKLTDSNSSNALVNNVGCNDNLKFTVKQEVDDVDHWEENQQSTIINNLDSNQNIKEEIKEVASYGSAVDDTSLIVGERLKSNGSPHISSEVSVNNNNVDNINGIPKEKVILPQPGSNYPNQYVINGNINLNSRNQANMSDDMQPVNLSVVKDQNSRENDYSTNHFKMGKRKRYSYGISSVTEDRSNTCVSVGMSSNSIDKMFCPMIFNPEFCKNSSYSQILKPTQTGENSWEQTTPIHSSYIEESSVPNSHLSYSHSHQSTPDEVGNSFRSSVQNRTQFMTYNNVTTSILKGSYDEKPTGVFHLSKSPIQDLYSDMSIHLSETSEKIMRCSCDKCLSISPPEVMQGCDRCDNVPTYLHKMSENLNSTGEELFRRIEESLAETETLKSQEEELLKRIAKSLNEAETLKFKEEELLKKIERSLTEAETLKTREEEILRRIEVSLAKSETVRSQDDELFMKIEASLQNAQYSVTDEDIEFESKCNINLDFSLPLKKRKKRLKTLIQKEDVKPRAQQNLSVESFPSYPSRPMISIAELLHKNVPVFEHPSAASPVSHYNSKPLYYRDVSMEPKCVGVLNCSNKNNMDSKMFSFCKSEGNRASCSYNGISNTYMASSIEEKVYKDLIKRESESPVLTEQNGMMNFNSGLDTNEDSNKKHSKKVAQKLKMNLSIIKEEENKELVCKLKMDLPIIKKEENKELVCKLKMDLPIIKKEENKELVCKLKMDLPVIKKEDNKEMNLRHEVESINKGKKCSLQDKNALDNENSSKSLHMNKDGMKQEVCPINCEFIKKENIFD